MFFQPYKKSGGRGASPPRLKSFLKKTVNKEFLKDIKPVANGKIRLKIRNFMTMFCLL